MDYLGRIIQMAVQLRRLENGAAVVATDPLRRLFHDILSGLPDDAGELQMMAARQQLLSALQSRLPSVIARAEQIAGSQAVEIAAFQSEVQASALARAAGIGAESISRARLREIFEGDAIEGRTAQGWFERTKLRAQAEAQKHINLSAAANETPDQLKERIRTYVFKPAERQVEALTRTVVNNVANAAQFETAEASPRVTKFYRLHVTLDRRTSYVCLAIAAEHKLFPYAPESPRPPFHFACRTIIEPVLIGREHDKKEDAGDWLKRQGAAEQDEILGKKRAELFRKGRLNLDQLVRSDNSIATIPELRGVASGFGLPMVQL